MEYLKDKKEEVVSMFMEEWDEEAFREQLREDAIAEGLRDGRAEGRVAALAEAVGNVMASLGLDAERAMEAVGVTASDRQAILGRL